MSRALDVVRLSGDEYDDLMLSAQRYKWLRDYSLQALQSGPICVMADLWGKPLTRHVGDDPGLGPAMHITMDGKELDFAIDDAIERWKAGVKK